jgi:Fe-S-cluster containining protein
MEKLFQHTALTEYQKCVGDLSTKKDASSALTKSHTRYHNLIAKAVEESPVKPACKSGCAYCCHYKVEVRAPEIFLIKEHLQHHFTTTSIHTILAEAEANAQLIKTLTPEQHLSTNIKCPFLKDNSCSIYTVRPFKCRNFHATSVSGCETSFNNPSDLQITTSMIETVTVLGDAHTQGFEVAIKNAGLDAAAYDLNTALLEAFTETNAIKRFKRGKKAFVHAITIDENR